MRPTLIVMVKEPRPGRVKTRLGRDIGMTCAAWCYRHQVARVLRRLRDPRWHLVLAVSPDRDGCLSRVWPPGIVRWPQGGGDLGDRMLRMLHRASGPACLIGSDIPGVSSKHIARAFGLLGSNDAVLGPAPDGGFWLIGARHPGRINRRTFQGVRWSTPDAFDDTRSCLNGARIGIADTLADVDGAGDLPRS